MGAKNRVLRWIEKSYGVLGFIMSIWKSSTLEYKSPWGSIVSIQTPFGMNGKILYFEKGKRNSLKYYEQRNQCLYCLSGKLIVTAPQEIEFGNVINQTEGSVFELNPGETILIQARNPYRVKALEDSVLVEVLLGGNFSDDIVMLEDDYGRI